MKILCSILLALLICAGAFAQNFAGTVTYGIAMSNPPQGVDPAMFAKFMPSKAVYNFGKDGGFRFSIDGPAGMDVLVPAGSKNAYLVKESKKTLYVMDEEQVKKYSRQGKDGEAEKPEITKTTETETILGHVCTKYNIKTRNKKGDANAVTTQAWVSGEFHPAHPKMDSQGLFSEEIDGMPLKMVTKTNGMDITMTATEIVEKAPDASLFVKPAGYAEEPFTVKAMIK